MVTIIPNWHPILVHFTIGLLGTASLLYLAGLLLKKDTLLVAARWNLWIGTFITFGTILAGFDAYYTVNHDSTSHAAMTDHRNWALATAITFTGLTIWDIWKQRTSYRYCPVFAVCITVALLLLVTTGYKGGELVYRHGLGVLRLPLLAPPVHNAPHYHDGHGHHPH